MGGARASSALCMLLIAYIIVLRLNMDNYVSKNMGQQQYRRNTTNSIHQMHRHASYLTLVSSPSSNTVELLVIHNRPCKHNSTFELSTRITPSRCLDMFDRTGTQCTTPKRRDLRERSELNS